jgi:type I restriction enzyme S subunit
LRFRCHRDAASEYLFRWLNYLRASGYFTAQRNVSSINSVYNASLSATIPVACPVDSEQIQIVTLLSAIDDKITLHKRKKAALEALFTSLLHQLMTGKIRVGDLDLSSLNAPQTEAA